MFDFDRIVGFEWDEGNAWKSEQKHAVSQAEAEQIFFNEPLLIADDILHSQEEPRFHALGKADNGRLLHLTFMLRAAGTKIRVISARTMSRKERAYYEKTI